MIDAVLIGLAALCAGYFAVIVLYAGIGTSFAFIWLFFAALCLFLVYGKWYYRRNADRIPRWVPVSVVTTCVAGLTVFAAVCIMVFSGVAGSDPVGLDYVIVLGAQGKEHTVNGSLKLRLDKAIEYVEENPDTILVLSGGPMQGEEKSEAELMYDYLRYNGVRPDQMLMEKRSASTVENVAFSVSSSSRTVWPESGNGRRSFSRWDRAWSLWPRISPWRSACSPAISTCSAPA